MEQAIYLALVPVERATFEAGGASVPLFGHPAVEEAWLRIEALLDLRVECRYVVDAEMAEEFEDALDGEGLSWRRADEEQEMTVPDAAEAFGIPYFSLAQAVREKRVAARRLGRQWFVTPSAIRAALAQEHLRPRNIEAVMEAADALTDRGRHAPPGMED